MGVGALKEACSGNLTLGPLYADSKEVASALLHRLLSTHPLASIQNYPKLYLTFPSSNSKAVEWLIRSVADGAIEWKRNCERMQFTREAIQVIYAAYTRGKKLKGSNMKVFSAQRRKFSLSVPYHSTSYEPALMPSTTM